MIEFIVFGHPEPQGSTRAFIPKGWKRAIITSDNSKLKPWRQEITRVAMDKMAQEREGLMEPYSRETPIALWLDFYLDRPQTLPRKFTWPVKRPDLDKLSRAVKDALTGVVYVDDSQVVQLGARKFYGHPERVVIKIQPKAGFLTGRDNLSESAQELEFSFEES